MRCVAVIEAQRPGLDSVLIWDQGDQLVAFAYEDGRVKMTRPLAASSLEQGVDEVLQAFQINQGQMTRITDWTNQAVQAQPVATPRARWE